MTTSSRRDANVTEQLRPPVAQAGPVPKRPAQPRPLPGQQPERRLSNVPNVVRHGCIVALLKVAEARQIPYRFASTADTLRHTCPHREITLLNRVVCVRIEIAHGEPQAQSGGLLCADARGRSARTCSSWAEPTSRSIRSARGMGEIGITGIAAAIANAVNHAASSACATCRSRRTNSSTPCETVGE